MHPNLRGLSEMLKLKKRPWGELRLKKLPFVKKMRYSMHVWIPQKKKVRFSFATLAEREILFQRKIREKKKTTHFFSPHMPFFCSCLSSSSLLFVICFVCKYEHVSCTRLLLPLFFDTKHILPFNSGSFFLEIHKCTCMEI